MNGLLKNCISLVRRIQRTHLSKFILYLIFSLIYLCIYSDAFALAFSIIPKPGTILPYIYLPTRPATAYYTVINNMSTPRKKNYVKSLPPNVTQVVMNTTYEDTCGLTFDLAAHGQPGDSCTLQLAITGEVHPQSQPFMYVCLYSGIACASTFQPLDIRKADVADLIGLQIKPNFSTFNIGASQQYVNYAVYLDNALIDVSDKSVWSTSEPNIAQLSKSGLVTGVSKGTAKISSTYGGMTVYADAIVVPEAIIGVSLNFNVIEPGSPFNIIFNQSGQGKNEVSAKIPNGFTFKGPRSCIVSQQTPTCSLTIQASQTTDTYEIVPTLISGFAQFNLKTNPLSLKVYSPTS